MGSCDGCSVGDGLEVTDFVSACVADAGVIGYENDLLGARDFVSACAADAGVIGYENDVLEAKALVRALLTPTCGSSL